MFYRCSLLLPVVLSLGLFGCEQSMPTYPAGGKVTFPNGKPLDGGRVEFLSCDTDPPVNAWSEIKPDGTFQLVTKQLGDGAVEGRHRVVVFPWIEPGTSGISAIDYRYRRYKTSGLEFTVSPDATQNNFHITVKPPEAKRAPK